MAPTNKLRVSIVIPVYNEASHLAACLRAIGQQTSAPLEVIVVDNNSTDATAAIAKRFSFVTLLRQPKQGVVYARDTGFNAAKGEIIGRLDADSIVAEDWVATLQQLFTDSSVSAITGSVQYYGIAADSLLSNCDLVIRRYMAKRLGREVAMQGANLAVRRSAWQAVRGNLCRRGQMHEDFDLSIHLAEQGYLNRFDERLLVAIDFRRLESTWQAFNEYIWLSPRTYKQHGLISRLHMYPIGWLVLAAYWPLKLLHRGFNQQTQTFDWQQLLTAAQTARVNPATFVD